MSSFISNHGHSGITVKVVLLVLSAVIDQKIFFLIDELQGFSLARLKMGCELNGQSRTRLLTESSVDASRKVDPKPSSIAAPIFPLSRLHGDATDRAGGRTEVTGYASLLPVRITGEYDHSPGSGRKGPLVFGVLFGHRFAKENLQRGCKPFDKTFDPFHKDSFL
jgi:hypothetical protein